MTLTAAAACVAASLALYPLFIDWRWFVVAVGAVIAAAAAGSVTRLRVLPWPACLAGGVVGLLLYLNVVFEASHSLLLFIPTHASLVRLWVLAGTGVGDAYTRTHPAPDLPGLLLLSTAGVGITAVLTDLIAVRLRSAALAGLPLLLLFTVPAMMDASYGRLGTAVVFCLGAAGYLAMLGADGRERIRVWGRLISSSGARPPHRAGAGRRAALTSVVLALVAPLLVAGLHSGNLFSSGPGAPSFPGAIAPVFGRPNDSRPSVVFTYTTTASASLESNDAQYFRQFVFDTLSGTGWQVSDYAGGSLLPVPPGLSDRSSSQAVKTTVTVGRHFPGPGPVPAFLPLPYPATGVDAPGKWLADADLMVYSTSDSIAGRTYSVESLAVDPSRAQLAAAPELTQTPGPAPDLKLPASYETTALRNLAETYSGGQSTEFGKVSALANWLSGPTFSYSHAPVPFHDAAGLLSFLTKSRSGFCVQYAWAMTVLTRLLGIPARMVAGYTAGTRLANGSYVVTSSDAHAWTEVYFPTLGWIRFEPTPGGGGTANQPNYMASSTDSPTPDAPVNPVTGEPAGPVARQPGSYADAPQLRAGPARPSRSASSPIESSGSPAEPAGTPWAALAVIVVIAGSLIAPAGARIALRRRRWSRATDDTSLAHAAWREFRDDLADYGVGPRPGETPRRLASRVTVGLPEPAAAAIRKLALAEEHTCYSARPFGAQHLRRDSAAARRGLAARAHRAARWRARLFPASVMMALADAAARIPSLAAALTRHQSDQVPRA
jgi:transglutaminase-like putative cysteine protease